MLAEAVEHFKKFGRENDILLFEESSATVELAAIAVGVEPARIAKTLSFKKGEGCVLVVTAGDVKIDNRKFKDFFGTKAKMLTPDQVFEFTGHRVGGVCPFGLTDPETAVYIDESIYRFDTVFPACGTANSAIELSPQELYEYSGACERIDICKPQESAE